MKYFFWYCLKKCEFNKFNIGTWMQLKRRFSSCTKWANSKFIFILAFICLQLTFLFQHWKKNNEHIYHSLHVYATAGNILITINHLLLASSSTFIADYLYLGPIRIGRNLNEHSHCLVSIKFVIWQIDANCSLFKSLSMLCFHIRLERVSDLHMYLPL